jgi:murein DD-endopeptidase MepM/ murein hydrolase activator NlpD/pSer/pThr/pTyr-binding forkhead associated (FHA) protein
MDASSRQVALKVRHNDQPERRVNLEVSVQVIGRDPSCDLQLDDPKVSRRHCQMETADGRVTVTDLGSHNGTYLGSNRLEPGQRARWMPDQELRIGPFSLQLEESASRQRRPEPPVAASAAKPEVVERHPLTASRTWRIACGHGRPSTVKVGDQPILIGRDSKCDMVLDDPGVSLQQCRVHQKGNQLWVTDLSQRDTTRIGNEALPANTAQVWPEGTHLQLGPFALIQWAEAAPAPLGDQVVTAETGEKTSVPGGAVWLEWLRHLPWLPVSMVFGGLCLLVGISAGLYQVFLRPTPTPVAELQISPTEPVEATMTPVPPTAVDVATQTPRPTVSTSTGVMLPSPTPTYAPLPGCTPQSGGWMELPFPYDGKNQGFGTAEQFRAASQRTAAGGRINSFFDHQFPLYRGEADVIDSLQARDTMVLFDGSISLDRTSNPGQSGDFYSGHPGYDFSVYGWQRVNTPIETALLAVADAVFAGAGTDSLGNNYVLLTHDRVDRGKYQTSYLHLEPDAHFDRMLALAPGTRIQQGERIGTMGNTGNSTGHHLHFEVRRDCNNNGRFELAEAIDPYGFSPSLEMQVDPMDAIGCGGSEYLWIHTWDPAEEGGGCTQVQSRRQLDPTPFQGLVSLATFIFTTADPANPTRVPVWLTRANVSKVDLASIKVHRYEIDSATGLGNWVVVPESRVLADQSGRPYVEVFLNLPGKYTVTGRPIEDIIPPKTTIRLFGVQTTGVYIGTVTVELQGQDESRQGVREIHYSLDCGQTWNVYGDLSLRLTESDMVRCSSNETDQKGDEWGLQPNEYVILAAAVDWSQNWEQPASFQRFTFGQ